MKAPEESILRKAFRHEITWLIFLIGAIMAFVYNVIIPVNAIQLQLVQIQADIANIKTFDPRITDNANDLIKLKIQVEALQGAFERSLIK